MNKYIGVSGVARAGKNLFCDILIENKEIKCLKLRLIL
jgi:hypothetical protein